MTIGQITQIKHSGSYDVTEHVGGGLFPRKVVRTHSLITIALQEFATGKIIEYSVRTQELYRPTQSVWLYPREEDSSLGYVSDFKRWGVLVVWDEEQFKGGETFILLETPWAREATIPDLGYINAEKDHSGPLKYGIYHQPWGKKCLFFVPDDNSLWDGETGEYRHLGKDFDLSYWRSVRKKIETSPTFRRACEIAKTHPDSPIFQWQQEVKAGAAKARRTLRQIEEKKLQDQAYADAWPERVEAAARAGFQPGNDLHKFKLDAAFSPLVEFGLGRAHPVSRGGTAEERNRERLHGAIDIPRRVTILSETGKLIGNIDVRALDLAQTSSSDLVGYAKETGGGLVGVWNFVREDYFQEPTFTKSPECLGKLDLVRQFCEFAYWQAVPKGDSQDAGGSI